MTKDKIKQIVLDIIADIAPDEDLTDVKPEVDCEISWISILWIS